MDEQQTVWGSTRRPWSSRRPSDEGVTDLPQRRLRHRARRAEGQMRGVLRMIEEQRSCEEIVTQLLAVHTAVEHIAMEVVLTHMDECLQKLAPEQAREAVGRAVKLLGRMA